MIALRRLALRNFCRFRGEHVVVFPEAREVVVCSEHNAAGKTTLLEAVGFALWGHHAARYPRAADVVSAGESEAEVVLELSDGSMVTRRVGDRQTSLTFSGPRGTYEGAQSAQPAVAEHLGIERDGYLGAIHVQQGRADALADATPGRRREILLSWLDSARWEVLVEEAQGRCAAAQATLESLRGRLEECRRSVVEHRPTEVVEAEIAQVSEDVRAAAVAREARARNEQRAELAVMVREARARIAAMGVVEDQPDDEGGAAELAEVTSQMTRLLPVARGSFDGACPLAGAPCPRRDFVDASKASAAGEVAELQRRAGELRDAEDDRRRRAAERRRVEQQRGVLVGQYNQAVAHLRQWPLVEVPECGEHAAVERRLAELRAELEVARSSTRASARAAQLAEEVAAASTEVQAWTLVSRALRATPGPLAAARATIEASAAYLLEPFGIRVTVGGAAQSGLAGACPCGHRYRGQQLTCPRCQIPRGAGRDDAVAVVVDDGSAAGAQDIRVKSGAGRDLASLALYLASVGTNRRCQVGWRMYDESSSSLCGANRRAFVQMLRRAGACRAEQHVVVSHDREIIDAFEHRIEVVVEGQYSRIMQG